MHADAHAHCASRRDRCEKAGHMTHQTYEYISMWGAEDRRDTPFKPSVVTPYISVGRSWWSLTVVNSTSTQSWKAFYTFLWENLESSCAAERSFCRRSSTMFHTQNLCARRRPRLGTAIQWLSFKTFVQLVGHQRPYWREARIDVALVRYLRCCDTHKAKRVIYNVTILTRPSGYKQFKSR